MRHVARGGLLLALAGALGLAGAAVADRGRPERAELETLEGTVTALTEAPGEGGLAVVAADLDAGEGREPVRVLLAPAEVLDEIDFKVEVGDRLRVRIFADEDSPARAHRVLNLSGNRIVRLRTLRQIPLWSSTGVWQGGDARRGPGYGPGGPPASGGHRTHGAGGGPGSGGPGR
jgi:hypothetical protein